MNEFNPFDDLGITFDNPQENRRDKNMYNPFDSQEKFTVDPGNQPNFVTDSEPTNISDWEVKTELGIDLDTSLENDKRAAQAYVDALTDDEYATWRKLRNEWYSISATKALMENQDLLRDINKPGTQKYLSNKPTFLGELTEMAQAYNLWYEQNLHPWTQSIQDALNQGNQRLEEKLGKENMMNSWIDKQNPYWKMSPNLAEGTINNYETFVNMAQIPKVLAQMALSIGESWINSIDEFFNRVWIYGANLVNYLNEKKGTGKWVNLNLGEDRSGLIGSYLQTIADVLDIHLTTTYPIVTYIFWLLGANQTDRDSIWEIIDKWPEAITNWILDQDVIETFMDNNLNEEDKLAAKQAIKYWIYEVVARLLKWGGKKLSTSETVQNFKKVSEMVDNYWKKNAELETKKYYEMKEAAWEQPVWTEILEWDRPIAKSTEEGWKFTSEWALDTLLAGVKGYAKGVKEALSSYFRNKNRQLLERDPNAPVWELPEIGMKPVETEATKPTEEIQPKEEVTELLDDVKEKTAPKVRKAVQPTTDKGTMGEGITTFIKRVTNDLTSKEGWLDKAMVEKLKGSVELQNEYVNTIDPYLKSWWAENPEWVIKDQLADFVQTAKTALETRRENNMEFRKWQMKYKVEIPQGDRIKRKLEDTEIKDLLKILNKSQDNPAQFLQYLLNLPKEKLNTFDKLIPDFTQNLNLIKDTLDITKAITKPDIVEKFLSFKSDWRRGRRWFLKKMLYQYLRDKYKEMGVEYNMKEIETMLNKMDEQDILDLEKEINGIQEVGETEAYEWLYSTEKNLLDKGVFAPTKMYQALMRQWYISRPTKYSAHTVDDLLNVKLQRGWTVKEWMDRLGLHLEEAYWMGRDATVPAWIDVLAKTIYLYKSPEYLPEMALGHEIIHDLQAKLTTKEFLDFLEGLSKSTKGLKRPEAWKSMTEWKSLEKTEASAMEYGADIWWLLITHWWIRWLADFLQSNLSANLGKKVRNILNETWKEIWDNFSTTMVDGKEWNPTNELNKLIDMWLESPEKASVPLNKELSKPSHQSRVDYMKEVDPNIKDFEFELKDKDNLGRIKITTEKGQTLWWEEYKKTLTPEQLEKLWNEEPKVNLKKGEEQNFWGKEPKFDKYKEVLRDIDPDIVGIIEKDWELYIQVLFESMRERYELPDRPGMVELKTLPAKDFFLPADFEKLPEDLQKLIKKDAD